MKNKNIWRSVLMVACIATVSTSCKRDIELDGTGLSIREAVFVSSENYMGITVEEHTPLQLHAVLTPGNIETKEVRYENKHKDIIDVGTDGLVTPKSVGRDTLTVSTTSGASLAVSYVVDVVAQD